STSFGYAKRKGLKPSLINKNLSFILFLIPNDNINLLLAKINFCNNSNVSSSNLTFRMDFFFFCSIYSYKFPLYYFNIFQTYTSLLSSNKSSSDNANNSPLRKPE